MDIRCVIRQFLASQDLTGDMIFCCSLDRPGNKALPDLKDSGIRTSSFWE